MTGSRTFSGGVFADAIEGGRVGTEIDVGAGGLTARTRDGQVFSLDDGDCQLELGGASGRGRLWFGAYGGIYSRDIEDDFIVDTGHLVAYEPSVSLNIGMTGGNFSSFLSGEGLVSRVRGPGRIYLQSRSMDGLVSWTDSYLW